MKKFKQIFALIGVILLVCLYGSTLVFALMKHEEATNLLKASIFATTVIPIFLYAITLAYKFWGRGNKEKQEEN
jgi:hypothetical protein